MTSRISTPQSVALRVRAKRSRTDRFSVTTRDFGETKEFRRARRVRSMREHFQLRNDCFPIPGGRFHVASWKPGGETCRRNRRRKEEKALGKALQEKSGRFRSRRRECRGTLTRLWKQFVSHFGRDRPDGYRARVLRLAVPLDAV